MKMEEIKKLSEYKKEIKEKYKINEWKKRNDILVEFYEAPELYKFVKI